MRRKAVIGYHDVDKKKFIPYSAAQMKFDTRTRPAITKEQIMGERIGFFAGLRGEYNGAEFFRMFKRFILEARGRKELARLEKELWLIEEKRDLSDDHIRTLRNQINNKKTGF